MASQNVCERVVRDIAAIDDLDQRMAVVVNGLWIGSHGDPVETIRILASSVNALAAGFNNPETNEEVPRLLRECADLFEKSRIVFNTANGGLH